MKQIRMVIDDGVIRRYNQQYFALHPRAQKPPIPHPYHESINQWMIMRRPIMNALKARWKAFIVWFIAEQGYTNLRIDRCEMTFTTYFGTDRPHDVDNTVPKFILDGFTQSGFIVDDSSKHVTALHLYCGVDAAHPRTEIVVRMQSAAGIIVSKKKGIKGENNYGRSEKGPGQRAEGSAGPGEEHHRNRVERESCSDQT